MNNSFQTILLFVFGIGALIGVAAFALYRASGGAGASIPEMTMWGTLPEEYFSYLDSSGDDYLSKVSYREIRPERFDRELIEALADGVGPDIVLLEHDSIYEHKNRIYEIPFESYTASNYYDTFIQAAGIFESSTGFYALPAVIDPMVMYWNQPMLSSEGMSSPPVYWDDMRGFSEGITRTDGFLDVSRSAVSLGTYDNISHAKDILSLLLMQSGSPIVSRGASGYSADFSQTSTDFSLPPSEALNFYVEFANPEKTAYSWNASLPNSRDAFLSEDLALYFGLASEEDDLLSANPNLSYAVDMMPQVRSSELKVTTGDLYGFAIIRSTDSFSEAFSAVYRLAGSQSIAQLDESTGLPSVHKLLLKEDPTRASSQALIDSTRITRVWFDPDNEETEQAFGRLVDSVRSNAVDAEDALARLASEINRLFRD